MITEAPGVETGLAPSRTITLLRTVEILALDPNRVGLLTLIQQQTAQIAAIREAVEAEHTLKIADRVRQRGGPHCPPQQPDYDRRADDRHAERQQSGELSPGRPV
jgi:hypothetical protein